MAMMDAALRNSARPYHRGKHSSGRMRLKSKKRSVEQNPASEYTLVVHPETPPINSKLAKRFAKGLRVRGY